MICNISDEDPDCCNEVQRLRELTNFKDIPILVAATVDQRTKARSAVQMGAAGSLIKPFESKATSTALQQALQPVGTKQNINMEIIKPFIDQTIEVIQTMAKEKPVRNSMYLKTNYTMIGDVSGLMGITGETEGVVAVTFHQDLAFDLVAKMVGCSPDDLSVDDVNDGIGELINMIAGSTKKNLSGTRYEFSISLPTVVMGHGHQIAHQRNVPVIVVVFDCNGRPFAVQLCVTSAQSGSQSAQAVQKKEERALASIT